jgi:hypothetical protein
MNFECLGGDNWESCGTVSQIEPSKRAREIVRFECSRTFADLVAAKNHGLEVARKCGSMKMRKASSRVIDVG